MLKFIVGRASSGKTTEILKRISADCAGDANQIVLIVPEQFSFESERELVRTLKDSDSSKVQVLSFSRLADTIAKIEGAIAGTPVSDFDRVVLIGRVMMQLKDELVLWGKYASSFEFIKSVAASVCELKMSDIGPNALDECASMLSNGLLKNKLHDLSIILSGYNSLLENKFTDPLDSLSILARQLEKSDYFKDKNVYFDSFKGFTGQQYAVIKRIMQKAANVTVSLNSDGDFDNDVGTFSTVNKLYFKLVSIAKELGTKVDEPYYLKKGHYNCSELLALEEKLGVNSALEYNADADNITLCIADTKYDEAAFVACTIHNLVRTKGYRYRDFVVIARDANAYESIAEGEFLKNDIPFFMDRRVPLSTMPFAVFIDHLLKSACDISTDNILCLLKTGLSTLREDEIYLLENYTYIWKIDRKQWLDEWDMDPNGFDVADDSKQDEIAITLADLNRARSEAIKPVLYLKQQKFNTAKDIAVGIYKIITELNIQNNLSAYADRLYANSKINEAELQKKSYSAVLEVLDGIVRCVGDENLSISEFLKLWQLSLSTATIGNIPQMLDEITFGAADRIRPSRPKVVFVMGVNQDVFPARPGAAGLFAIHERSRLAESGLGINDMSIDFMLEENYLLYSSICCASELVYISCCKKDENSVQLLPSAVFDSIARSFSNCNKVTCSFDDESLPETKQAGFNKMLAISYKKGSLYNSLLKFYSNDSEYSLKLAELDELSKISDFSLTPSTAIKLFGKNINLSASRFDTYHKCKFSHFLRYGLNAKTLKPAELDVLKKGTIVHFVFENLFKEYSENICTLKTDELEYRIDSLIEQYINLIIGVNSIRDAKFTFTLNKLSEITKVVACHIIEELSQSDFKPSEFELKIGKNSTVVSNTIPLQKGLVTINGSIDRVDIYNGYIRVIDYKTGRRKFKLPDIYCGLNLQMLIYLYAVIKSNNEKFNSLKPAGILYMPSRREIGSENSMAMNGLIALNDDVISAMDKENKGEYIPKIKYNKDGSLSKTCTSFVNEEDFGVIFDHITKLITDMGDGLHNGQIGVSPVDSGDLNACKYCDFASVCRCEDLEHGTVPDMTNDELLDSIKRGENSGV